VLIVAVDSHRQSTVYNRYATLIFTNPVFLGFSRYQNVKFGSQRDNIKKIDISKSPDFSGLSLCQKFKNKHFFE